METNRLSGVEAWPRCPNASEYFNALFRAFAAHNPSIASMADRFLECAGVPLTNLIDHWSVPDTHSLVAELGEIGLVRLEADAGGAVWEHPAARLPRVRVEGIGAVRMAIAVEDLALFAEAIGLELNGRRGDPDSAYEEARFPLPNGELAVVVRRGYRGFLPGACTASEQRILARARERLSGRTRDGDAIACAQAASALLISLSDELDTSRLTDEFFASEREYYMRKNRAARWQYERQQELGIGWANHDHHTYRSSRSGFQSLLNLWLDLGFEAREKFYAGAEAGWGAQILEHPASRVVLFCDVDMAPEEIGTDFGATRLEERDRLGTIGLWCGLHGESIASAGLHHLEAEFDFARVRDQLEAAGLAVMPPFTDLPMLKQAFTVGETWPVSEARASRLHDAGLITAAQRDRFLAEGALGSHLEILQRWEGFKGFNKTGINDIIRKTDARETSGAG